MTLLSTAFVNAINQIIVNARQQAFRNVNQQWVLTYWYMGQHLAEEEQNGKERAGYGTQFIRNLANELLKEFGSGFSVRQLELRIQFYLSFPITNALRSQLNRTQYKPLLRVGQTLKIQERLK